MSPTAADRLIRFIAGTFTALVVVLIVAYLQGPTWAAAAFGFLAYTVVIQSGAKRP